MAILKEKLGKNKYNSYLICRNDHLQLSKRISLKEVLMKERLKSLSFHIASKHGHPYTVQYLVKKRC